MKKNLKGREYGFHLLVEATHKTDPMLREICVKAAASYLTADEVYHANTVIALFNFYNKFVDLNGVDELTADGYVQSGIRLSQHGYAPPATK